MLVQTDHYIGEMVVAIDKLGIAKDTLIIVTADNGAEDSHNGAGQSTGWTGPWDGTYNVPVGAGRLRPASTAFPSKPWPASCSTPVSSRPGTRPIRRFQRPAQSRTTSSPGWRQHSPKNSARNTHPGTTGKTARHRGLEESTGVRRLESVHCRKQDEHLVVADDA